MFVFLIYSLLLSPMSYLFLSHLLESGKREEEEVKEEEGKKQGKGEVTIP